MLSARLSGHNFVTFACFKATASWSSRCRFLHLIMFIFVYKQLFYECLFEKAEEVNWRQMGSNLVPESTLGVGRQLD